MCNMEDSNGKKMANTISTDATFLEALGHLNAQNDRAHMTLFVVDGDGVVCGTLTDGDIRRALLSGEGLDSPVTQACFRSFRYIAPDDSARQLIDTLRQCREKGITMVPRLDADGRIAEILDLTAASTRLPLRAVLMAGGRGERLRPMTLSTPKPLLQIEGKAIIDYNVEALAAAGIEDITVCTRYLAEQIEEHFSTPVGGVDVRCVREEHPMGTIGAVALTDVPESEGETIVMNSDLLTTISYEDMYMRHLDSQNDITIAVVPFQVSVPFAILSFDPEDPGRVTALEEKPTYSHYANAGIYIIRNELLREISAESPTDAPDFIASAISAGARVGHYIIKGTWIDVGSPADFQQASDLMKHHKAMTH